MSILEVLAGCCPFLKNTSRAESDENLLNPDSTSLASDNNNDLDTPNISASTDNRIQPDPNNNIEKDNNSIKSGDEDSELSEISNGMHDLDDDFQPSECVKNLSARLVDVIDTRNINMQADFENFKAQKSFNQKESSNIVLHENDLPEIVLKRRKLDHEAHHLSIENSEIENKFVGGIRFYANNNSEQFNIDSSVLSMLNSIKTE